MGTLLRCAKVICVAIILCNSGGSVYGQTVSNWTDSSGGNWDDATNWDTLDFPNNNGTTFEAVIDLITGSAYQVKLNAGQITLDALTLDSIDATLLIDGSDKLSVLGTAAINNGLVRLNGGVIDGGTWNFGSGGTLVATNSSANIVRNGATLNLDLALTGNSYLRFQSGAMFSGDATLSGSGTQFLAIEDTTTLSGKTINLNNNSSYFSVDGDNTVTLASDVLVRGRGYIYGGLLSGTGTQAMINAGTIRSDLGQTMTVESPLESLANTGVIEAINGSTMTIRSNMFTNTGTMNVTDGSVMRLNSSGGWSSAGGTITVDGTSQLEFEAPFTTAGLGAIDNSAGGNVWVETTWDNSGDTFTFTPTTGSWWLRGGNVSGGVITPGVGGETMLFNNSSSNRFRNGALFDGDLVLTGNSYLRFQSGATFSGDATLSGSGTQFLAIEETTTLSGKTINLNNNSSYFSVDGDNTVTLASDVLVRGRGYIYGGLLSGTGTQAMINEGTIRSDLGQTMTVETPLESLANTGVIEAINGSTMTIRSNMFTNTGTMNVTDGSVMRLNSSGGWSSAGGTITVDGTSQLEFEAPFTTAGLGAIDNSAGGNVWVETTWDNSGDTFTFTPTTGSWWLRGGNVSGGVITPGTGGETLRFNNSSSNRFRNGALFDGDLALTGSSYLRFQSGAMFSGDATLSGGGTQFLAIEDTVTLAGKTINLNNNNSYFSVDGNNTVTLASDVLVRGRGYIYGGLISNTGTQAMINAGTIRSDLGQTMTIHSPLDSLTNQGTGVIEAINGSAMHVTANNFVNQGAASATDSSTLLINGVTMTNAGALSATVNSVLRLASSGGWSSTGGTITIDGTSRLELEAPFTTADLASFDNSEGGTVWVETTWDNSGESFTFSPTTGTWWLHGGNVSGGVITPGVGGETMRFNNSSSNRFRNGALFDGDLALTGSSYLRFQSGAMFSGDATLSGSGTQYLTIEDTTTLSGKTINLENTNSYFSVDGNNTVTLASDVLVRGRGYIYGGLLYGSGTQVLINEGTIRSDLGQTMTIHSPLDSLTNQGTGVIEAINGSALNVTANNFDNQGAASATDGSTLWVNGVTMTNAGALSATVGSVLRLASSGGWSNAGGTITIDGTSRLELESPFTTLDLATFDNSEGGTVWVETTWDNSDESFTFTPMTGTWWLHGGNVSGGVITPGVGGETMRFNNSSSNRFRNGALFDGDLALTGSSYLRFQSGAMFSGDATLSGSGTQYLAIEDTVTLAGKTINLENTNSYFSVDGNNTVTLASDVLVRGRGYIYGGLLNASGTQAMINAGTIRSDLGQTMTIHSPLDLLTNQGTGVIEAINGSTLSVTANNFDNQGSVLATDSSTLLINGVTMTNAGALSATVGSVLRLASSGGWSNAGGTITIDGTSRLELESPFTTADLASFDNSEGGTVWVETTWNNSGESFTFTPTTGSWWLHGGSVSGGVITPGVGGETMRFNNSTSNRFRNGALFDGDLALTGNSYLRFQSGAMFSGDATLSSSGTQYLAIEDTTTLSGKTINLNNTNSYFSVDGNNTLTLASDMLVRGRGYIYGGLLNSSGTQVLINEGTIRSDIGQTMTIHSPLESLVNQGNGVIEAINGSTLNVIAKNFENQGVVSVSGGGALNFSTSISNLVNLSSGTLTGGSWRVFDASKIEMDEGIFTVNAADITLSGVGSSFTMTTSNHSIESRLVSNAAGGALRILDERNYTATAGGSFNNAGVIQLGGGAFDAPTLMNQAGAELFGFGTVTPVVANSGTVRAVGGTLVTGVIDGASGTVQVDADGVLDLSGAAGSSDADFLIHNGTAADSLNFGANDFIVSIDYNNGNFGVGDSFNPRANVAGTGLILTDVATAQSISGTDVTGGDTATPTLNFGNVRVGIQSDSSVTVQHDDGGLGGVILRMALKTGADGGNITDNRLSGTGVTAGNVPLLARGESTELTISFLADALGPLTGQTVMFDNNFDNVDTQILSITGEAFIPAVSSITPGGVFGFGNAHVGDSLVQILPITNNASAGSSSEDLDVLNIMMTGDASLVAGSPNAIQNILAGATDNSVSFQLATTTAGAKTGLVAADQVSTAEVNNVAIDGLAPLNLPGISLSVQAKVYGYATPDFSSSINLGEMHVGDDASGSLSVSNNTAADGFHEDLHAIVASSTGDITSASGEATLASGENSASSLGYNLATASPGAKSGTVNIDLTSLAQVDGVGITGLSDTLLTSGQFTVAAEVYALAQGAPVIPDTMDFGVVHVGDSLQIPITLQNVTPASGGFTEFLDASVTGTTGQAQGTGSIDNLAPGATNTTSMTVELDSTTPGAKAGVVTLGFTSDPNGINSLGVTVLPTQDVDLMAQVNNFAAPLFQHLGGAGSFLPVAPNEFTLDFGSISLLSGPLTAQLDLSNDAPLSDSDTLSGNFDITTPAGFSSTGFTTFSDLIGGASLPLQEVTFTNFALGLFEGSIVLNASSDNTSTQTPFDPITINLTAKVYASAASQIAPDPMDFGNVHVGETLEHTFTITNTVTPGAFSEDLDVLNISASANAALVVGSPAEIQNLLAGANNTAVSVEMDSSTVGVKSGAVTADLVSTAQVNGVDIVGLDPSNLPGINVAVIASVFDYAQPQFSNINLGEVHAGAASGISVEVSNAAAADGFHEDLRVAITGFSGDVTSGVGTIDIAAGDTSNTNLNGSVDLTTPGAKAGTIDLSLTSLAQVAATPIAGLNNTPLNAGQVNVSASVFALAHAAPISPVLVDFGIVHVDDPLSQAITVHNMTPASGGFTELLDASVSSMTGNAMGSGVVNLLGPGGSDSSSLTVGFDSSTAGEKSGSVTFALSSNPNGINALGITALDSQSVNLSGQVNNYAAPLFQSLGGDGTLLAIGPNEFTLDFGSIPLLSGPLNAQLGLFNDAPLDHSDNLSGNFDISAGTPFSPLGFDLFSDLIAGDNLSFGLTLDDSSVGEFNNVITFAPSSDNASSSTPLPMITLNILGEIEAIPGDFDFDADLDSDDIDLLSTAIISTSSNLLYDFNGDSLITPEDGYDWLASDGVGLVIGDFNYDFNVNLADLILWAQNFGSGSVYSRGDATFDGLVNIADLIAWAQHFGQIGPGPIGSINAPILESLSSATSIPEPSSLLLLGLGWMGMMKRKCRAVKI